MARVPPEAEGMRLDRFLKNLFPKVSRPEILEAIEQGKVRVGGRRAVKGRRVSAGDEVVCDTDLLWTAPEIIPNPKLPLHVVFEDRHLIVFDKPGGMPVHPIRWQERETLANGAVARFPELLAVGGSPKEAGFVHRLDTGTSGLIVAARDPKIYPVLRRMFSGGGVEKVYEGLVWGRLEGSGEMGEERRTEFAVQKTYAEATLLRLRLVGPGRRHQIREDLATIGHPLVGDDLYGTKRERFGLRAGRHFLHASELLFAHPMTGAAIHLRSTLPPDLARALKVCSSDNNALRKKNRRPPPPHPLPRGEGEGGG